MIYKHKIITLMTIFSLMSVVWGQFDITPPELENIEVLTDSVDISNEPQSVFVNLTVSDDMSGFSYGQIMGRSPGGSDNTNWNFFNGSGELFLEISNLELVVPTEVELGEWTFWLQLYDVSGNQFNDFSIGSFQVTYGETSNQLGDVNMDGSIDILDIVVGVNIILNLIEYSDEEYELLDYNQDGECNVIDIVLMVNYILDI